MPVGQVPKQNAAARVTRFSRLITRQRLVSTLNNVNAARGFVGFGSPYRARRDRKTGFVGFVSAYPARIRDEHLGFVSFVSIDPAPIQPSMAGCYFPDFSTMN